MGASSSITGKTGKKKTSSKVKLNSQIISQNWRAAYKLISSGEAGLSALTSLSPSDGQSSPLHVLVGFHPPIQLIEKFIERAPENLRKRGYQGFTCLHIACHQAPDKGFFKRLPDTHHPQNKTPRILQLLSSESLDLNTSASSVEIVQTLLKHFPQSIQMKNRFGEYPFDRAFKTKNYEVLELLVDRWPECLQLGTSPEVTLWFIRRKRSELMLFLFIAYKKEWQSKGYQGNISGELWDSVMDDNAKYVYYIFNRLANYKIPDSKRFRSTDFGILGLGYHDCHSVIMSFVGVCL